MASHPQRILDACTGVGGLSLGLKLALPRSRVVCYLEREVGAAANIVARIQDSALDDAPIWDDIKAFDARAWRGLVDCFSGGYPCPPFSSAGLRGGSDDPRYLWPDFRRVTKELEPEWVFFENVEGHTRIGLGEVIRDLEGLGYQVEIGLFSNEIVGAPHVRRRVFILGRRQVGDAPSQRLSDARLDREQELRTEEGHLGYPRFEFSGGQLAYATSRRSPDESIRSDPQAQVGVSESGADGGVDEGRTPQRAVRRVGVDASRSTSVRGVEVPDPGSSRLQGSERSDPRSGERDGPDAHGSTGELRHSRWPLALPDFGLFPPGPESSEWIEIIKERPELDPATKPIIRGMVDGSPFELDLFEDYDHRIRSVGNSVSPLVGALAYCLLRGRFE